MDFDSARPIYQQIIDLYKRALIAGELKPGDKIQSQRDFAESHSINPNTVQRAYREMEAQGLVSTMRGQGTFVAVTVEMLERMKEDLAQAVLGGFVREMKALGFSRQEALELAQKEWEKGEQGE